MIQLVEKGFRPMNINILLMFKKVEENIYPMREKKKKRSDQISIDKKYNIWSRKYTGWD